MAESRRLRTQADEHGNTADDCGHCTLLPGVNGDVRAAQVGCPVHSGHPAARRLRTQAERADDGTTWRATAASRPGYATYPQTPPGSPSWWLRYGEPEIHHHAPARPPHLGPAPVDGETCKRWCGFCHLGTGAEPDPRPNLAAGEPAIGPGLDIWMTTEQIAPPRRRWWHRYTRRTR